MNWLLGIGVIVSPAILSWLHNTSTIGISLKYAEFIGLENTDLPYPII
jgi:hypothetical protein